MVDPHAQEDENSSDELADVTDDSPDGSADSPNGGDNSEDDTTDDTGSDDLKEPMIPKSRLDEVIAQRDRERDTNKLFASLLANNGLDASGKKLPATKVIPKADLSRYKPEEIEQAKGLVHEMLKDDLGAVSELQTQLDALKKRDEDRELADKRRQATEFEKADKAELTSVLKSYKGEFKESDVGAQVVKWDSSGDPKLKYLARAPYAVVVAEMKRMKDARLSKKPKAAPKVDADDRGTPLRKPSNPLVRPVPGDSQTWKDRITAEAHEMMTVTEE